MKYKVVRSMLSGGPLDGVLKILVYRACRSGINLSVPIHSTLLKETTEVFLKHIALSMLVSLSAMAQQDQWSCGEYLALGKRQVEYASKSFYEGLRFRSGDENCSKLNSAEARISWAVNAVKMGITAYDDATESCSSETDLTAARAQLLKAKASQGVYETYLTKMRSRIQAHCLR